LALLSICAGSSAAIGALVKTQTKWHGLALFILFVVTGIIQYTTNSHFEAEIFTDEGFGHDDSVSTPVVQPPEISVP